MVYVELNPETDEPMIVNGLYAIQEDSFTLGEFESLEEAEKEATSLNRRFK